MEKKVLEHHFISNHVFTTVEKMLITDCTQKVFDSVENDEVKGSPSMLPMYIKVKKKKIP